MRIKKTQRASDGYAPIDPSHSVMNRLQEAFETQLEKSLRPEKIGTQVIAKRFKEVGIELNQRQVSRIEAQLLNSDEGIIHIEVEDDQVVRAGFTSEVAIQEALAASVGNLVSNIERFVTDLYDNLPRIVREMMTEISDLVLQRLKRSARPMLRDRRTTMSLFEANLSQVWGKAIDLLEMHLAMSIEAGESFNAEFRPSASSNNDYVFEVLSRLHARACQVASEVITLLKAGHADGAHARWSIMDPKIWTV